MNTPDLRPSRDLGCRECLTPWPDPKAHYPRTCTVCGGTAFRNVIPVGVLLLPIEGREDEVLVIRRVRPPLANELALVGGFMEAPNERLTEEQALIYWKMEAVREVKEEIDLDVDPNLVQLLDVASAPSNPNNLLVFAVAPPVALPEDFVPNAEVSEIVPLTPATADRLPWSTHRGAYLTYLRKRAEARELAALRRLRAAVERATADSGWISDGSFEDELRALRDLAPA